MSSTICLLRRSVVLLCGQRKSVLINAGRINSGSHVESLRVPHHGYFEQARFYVRLIRDTWLSPITLQGEGCCNETIVAEENLLPGKFNFHVTRQYQNTGAEWDGGQVMRYFLP